MSEILRKIIEKDNDNWSVFEILGLEVLYNDIKN